MGFLSDFKRASKASRDVQKALSKAKSGKPKATSKPMFNVTAKVEKPPKSKGKSDVYADPEEFGPNPILTIRNWDYGQGLNPGNEGYGFTAPDGRIWPGKNCKITLWKNLGILQQPIVGVPYHPEASGPSFAPGQPLRLVAEPDNPHSEKGTAIAVKNWGGDKVAGYIPTDRTARLRNLVRDQEFYVMSLSRGIESGKVTTMKAVIWLPGRLNGCDHIPASPPIADPPSS